MPRLWTLSDLHFENYPDDHPGIVPPDDFDVLVVAGDIYEGNPAECVRRVARMADGRPSVMVLGNHDVYFLPLQRAVDLAVRVGEKLGVTVLERSVATVEGLRFAGGTLWPDHFADAPARPDLTEIMAGRAPARFARSRAEPFDEPVSFDTADGAVVPLTYGEIEKAHRATLEVVAGAEPDVVVTHYPPPPGALARVPGASLWLYGHVHAFERRMEGGTEVVLNPRQSRVFADRMVIDVPVRAPAAVPAR